MFAQFDVCFASNKTMDFLLRSRLEFDLFFILLSLGLSNNKNKLIKLDGQKARGPLGVNFITLTDLDMLLSKFFLHSLLKRERLKKRKKKAEHKNPKF